MRMGKGLALVKLDIARAFDSVFGSKLYSNLRSKLGWTEECRTWGKLLLVLQANAPGASRCFPPPVASDKGQLSLVCYFAASWNGLWILLALDMAGNRLLQRTRTVPSHSVPTWMMSTCGTVRLLICRSDWNNSGKFLWNGASG